MELTTPCEHNVGEMQSEYLVETVLNPKTRVLERVTIEDLYKAKKISDNLMGNDPDKRKEFLLNFTIDPDDIDN